MVKLPTSSPTSSTVTIDANVMRVLDVISNLPP